MMFDMHFIHFKLSYFAACADLSITKTSCFFVYNIFMFVQYFAISIYKGPVGPPVYIREGLKRVSEWVSEKEREMVCAARDGVLKLYQY